MGQGQHVSVDDKRERRCAPDGAESGKAGQDVDLGLERWYGAEIDLFSIPGASGSESDAVT